MNWIGKILSLIWRGWFVFLAIISTFILGVFFIIPLCIRKKDFPKAYIFMRVWAYIVLYGSGIWLEKVNFKSFDHLAPYIVISNHTSMMDIMVMLILNKKPMVFVGKKELSSLPIFGYIFKRTHILVDRKNRISRKAVYQQSAEKLNERKSICIYPEGKVPPEEIFLDRFKDGAFSIAVNNQVPIITITTCGLKKILPYAYFKGQPGKVKVFLNSIESTKGLAKNDVLNLKNKSREEIYQTLQSCSKNKFHF